MYAPEMNFLFDLDLWLGHNMNFGHICKTLSCYGELLCQNIIGGGGTLVPSDIKIR